ncbi:hypothetical protein [Halogeometricum limi]|uniref:SPW repeat-containing protein n=1 Tax=Halogeometricum limi TaxID=555875 RepID=A0A1I6FQL4_9EURY|nr:hypothetical protein [Halogeometricum limi]SFR32242.1 hypothetical protein SAMN04488124_0086 [Halogeometricum limi]
MVRSPVTLGSVGRLLGYVAVLAGLVGAIQLFVGWVLPYLSVSPSGIGFVEGPGLGADNAPVAAFWAGVLVVLSILVSYAVRMESFASLVVLAVVLPVFAFLTGFSIGGFVAPFAGLVVLSTLAFAVDQFRADDGASEPDAAGRKSV